MLDLQERPQTRSPPARRWRNYYRVYRVLNLGRVGHWFPGVHGGPDSFPSQEFAESHALSIVAAINPPGRFYLDFAGAFPEGDRAN